MDIHLQVLAVLALGATTLWSAVPVGIALGLGPWATGIAAAAGAGLATALVFAVGRRLRSAPPAAFADSAARHRGLMYRAWDNYGAAGLGLLAPVAIGAPLGAAMGIVLGAPAGRLAFWVIVGIVLWSTGLTLLAELSLGRVLGAVPVS